MRRYQLAGARGGQGTTTVATVVAALAAGHWPTVLTATRPDDVCALAAVASTGSATTPLVPNLTLVDAALDASTAVCDAAVVVEDLGRLGDPAAQSPEKAPGAVRWLVVRGPCYLSLRAALSGSWRPDGVILLTEPGRALTAADVVDVLGLPVVAEIPVGPAVTRAIDAGLLLAHLHHLSAFRPLARLVQRDLGPDRLSDPSTGPPSTPENLTADIHPMRPSERETSSTDYAASSKLPPSGCRERRRPAAAASASGAQNSRSQACLPARRRSPRSANQGRSSRWAGSSEP